MTDFPSSTAKLAVALGAACLVIVGPLSMAGGLTAIEGMAYAALLCFLPHLLYQAFQFVLQPQENPVRDLMLAMGIRLVVVLAGTIVVCWHRPDLRSASFVVSLGLCYLVALAVETRLLITQVSSSSNSKTIHQNSIPGTPIGG